MSLAQAQSAPLPCPKRPPSGLFYLMRDTPLYRRGVFVGGSVLTLIVALVWLVERVFNLELIGF
jgi:hypothetical protein